MFVDEVSIPLAYHFGGLSSVLPSEILERIEFYPGNYSPEFGRGMGGVVDIGVRSPRKDRLGGLLQFDLIDGRVLAEGPLGENTSFTDRRPPLAWVDAWLGSAMEAEGIDVSVAPVYYDFQAMLEQQLGARTKLRLFAYGSDDRLEMVMNAPSAATLSRRRRKLHTSFVRVQARLETQYSRTTSAWNTSLSVGKDVERFSQGPIDVDTNVLGFEARSEFKFRFGDKVTAIAGVEGWLARYDVPGSTRRSISTTATPRTVVRPPHDPGRRRGLADAPGRVRHARAHAVRQPQVIPRCSRRLQPGHRPDDGRSADRRALGHRTGIPAHDAQGRSRRLPPAAGAVRDGRADRHRRRGEQQRDPLQRRYRAGVPRPLELSVEGFYKDLNDLVDTGAVVDRCCRIGARPSYGSDADSALGGLVRAMSQRAPITRSARRPVFESASAEE